MVDFIPGSIRNLFKNLTGHSLKHTNRTDKLQNQFGSIIYTEDAILKNHQRDMWALSEIEDFQGKNNPLPIAVAKPETTLQISQLLKFCNKHSIPVIPYGAGSGVCGAIKAKEDIVVLSMEKMSGLIEIDKNDLRATFWAGTNGKMAEDAVQAEGMTIGNWPQSIDISSVGGWVSTKASGQYSTAYGNTEDLILDIEAVLPDGSVINTKQAPRNAAGFDLRQLFLGTEGSHGIVTKVTFSLRDLPEASKGQAFGFKDMNSGLEAIRRIIRQGWKPPVARLYDAVETQRHFPGQFDQGKTSLFLIHEGHKDLVDIQSRNVKNICINQGGSPANKKLIDKWLKERNKVPTFRELLEKGIVADTIEVSATWGKVPNLYKNVIEALNTVPGIVMASGHSSHSYRSGTNIYFTFAVIPQDKSKMDDVYKSCWKKAMNATINSGGSIAHHHGIGRVRREYLLSEVGETGLDLLRKIKHAVDENNILNPELLPSPKAQKNKKNTYPNIKPV